jgi:hypothetical protein
MRFRPARASKFHRRAQPHFRTWLLSIFAIAGLTLTLPAQATHTRPRESDSSEVNQCN